jgi:hypothetical protein
MVSGDGFISKWVKAESGTGVGKVLVEAEPPVEAWPEVWLLDAEDPFEEDEDPVDVDAENALVGLPVARLEPVGDAVVDALLTVLP